MKDCENCDYTDIADWEQDARTGKATPIYWCERYKKLCSEITKCKYKAESDIEIRKPCINYEDGCEEWAGCPCVHFKARK